MFTTTIIPLLVLLPATALAIIHGRPAEPQFASSYAAVSFAGLRTCGAVVISPRTVLTGAHCLSIGGVDFADIANSMGLLSVAYGSVTPSSANVEARVRNIVVHPEYAFDLNTGAITNDIALITLKEPLEHATFAEISSAVPARGIAVGLGLNDNFELDQPDRLYQVSLAVKSVEGGIIVSGSSEVDGKSNIPSICWGDSGGGFYEPTDGDRTAFARVFGLVSYELEPSRCAEGRTEEQYFTNLVWYKAWVDEQVQAGS